jgi:DNA-binding transcriptional regulator YdaS (Cro superfamily)
MINVTLTTDSPVKAAQLAVGGPSKLADMLKVSRQTLHKWRKRGWFPPHRIEAVEAVTGLPRATLERIK